MHFRPKQVRPENNSGRALNVADVFCARNRRRHWIPHVARENLMLALGAAVWSFVFSHSFDDVKPQDDRGRKRSRARLLDKG